MLNTIKFNICVKFDYIFIIAEKLLKFTFSHVLKKLRTRSVASFRNPSMAARWQSCRRVCSSLEARERKIRIVSSNVAKRTLLSNSIKSKYCSFYIHVICQYHEYTQMSYMACLQTYIYLFGKYRGQDVTLSTDNL